MDDFLGLIRKTAIQGKLQDFLEHFKGYEVPSGQGLRH
jgi:hypothetical protein